MQVNEIFELERKMWDAAVSALFYKGGFVTHEILSEKKFLSLAEKLCK